MMTVAKPISISLPSPLGMIAALRAFWRLRGQDVAMAIPTAASEPQHPSQELDGLSMDCARYARLLENELDRQHLTDVEREDQEILNRVRDALYADD